MRYIVVGLGLSGRSVLKYLSSTRKDIEVIGFDTRENLNIDDLVTQYPTVQFMLASARQLHNMVVDSDVIVLSPGIDPKDIGVKELKSNGAKITSDIELFVDACDKPILAITGTNGKSTVTKLTADILAKHSLNVLYGGNFGIPALDLLTDSVDIYVLELSSFQIDILPKGVKFSAGVVLNITPDHLDRYKEFSKYVESKLRLYPMLETRVIDADNKMLPPSTANDITYSSSKKSITSMHLQSIVDIQSLIKLRQDMFAQNILASIALTSSVAEVNEQATKVALQEFVSLEHRCEEFSKYNDKTWINDSKSTNPESTIAALNFYCSLNTNVHLIMGGVTKGSDFTELCNLMCSGCKSVILMGESIQELSEILHDRVQVSMADSITDAVAKADAFAKKHELVLFSPACASFDMFNNFEHRVLCFKEEVNRLANDK